MLFLLHDSIIISVTASFGYLILEDTMNNVNSFFFIIIIFSVEFRSFLPFTAALCELCVRVQVPAMWNTIKEQYRLGSKTSQVESIYSLFQMGDSGCARLNLLNPKE